MPNIENISTDIKFNMINSQQLKYYITNDIKKGVRGPPLFVK